MKKKPTHLKSILKDVISEFGKREREEHNILSAWEKAAGKKAVKHTKPLFIKEKKLVIGVSNSSWLYKLTTERRKLLKVLNAELKGKKEIGGLQFRIGQI